jgi:hypothetical protein
MPFLAVVLVLVAFGLGFLAGAGSIFLIMAKPDDD